LLERRFARVVAPTRRPLTTSHAKLTNPVIDFGDAAAIAEAVPKGVTDVFLALGTTIKDAGSRERFRAVDYTTNLAAARAGRDAGAAHVVLVSSLGADARSMTFYLRVKGELERDVQTLGYQAVHILRPSILDSDRQGRAGEKLGLVVMKSVAAVVGKTGRYMPIPVDSVGKAMVRVAKGSAPGAFIHNSERLHELGA
jgi:uncharacterized protein YbjT (DUF2867 family)